MVQVFTTGVQPIANSPELYAFVSAGTPAEDASPVGSLVEEGNSRPPTTDCASGFSLLGGAAPVEEDNSVFPANDCAFLTSSCSVTLINGFPKV